MDLKAQYESIKHEINGATQEVLDSSTFLMDRWLLRHFKNGWGVKEDIIKYYKYDLGKDAFVVDVPGLEASWRKIFQKTPILLLNILGQIMYKHMG